ncbi:MAG: hypothetical protein MK035_05645 [Dehalococcoidia bacterium]|nr:hypothetical protein [Dehalococcoidia bacterium]
MSSTMKNPFQLFAVLTMVGIGIYSSYRYVHWLVKGDISLIIGIVGGGTVIFVIISVVLYKMGYGKSYG